MRILLVRHGESLGNLDPLIHATTADHAVPLSDRGKEQARQAGALVARHLEEQLGGVGPTSGCGSARTSARGRRPTP